jgi:hypothetical protein
MLAGQSTVPAAAGDDPAPDLVDVVTPRRITPRDQHAFVVLPLNRRNLVAEGWNRLSLMSLTRRPYPCRGCAGPTSGRPLLFSDDIVAAGKMRQQRDYLAPRVDLFHVSMPLTIETLTNSAERAESANRAPLTSSPWNQTTKTKQTRRRVLPSSKHHLVNEANDMSRRAIAHDDLASHRGKYRLSLQLLTTRPNCLSK